MGYYDGLFDKSALEEEDRQELAEILRKRKASEGAEERFAGGTGKYAWRSTCEDGIEYGIDPDDYETEEEYNFALAEGKVAWRESCESGFDYDVYPEDYETEAEYMKALNAAKADKKMWKMLCEEVNK